MHLNYFEESLLDLNEIQHKTIFKVNFNSKPDAILIKIDLFGRDRLVGPGLSLYHYLILYIDNI